MIREYRTLVAGMSAIGVILVVGRVIPDAVHWTRARDADATKLAAELARTSADARLLSTLDDSVRARQLRLGDEFPSLLHGSSPAERAAFLSEVLRDAADAAGVRLGNVELQVDTSRAGVYARHRATADLAGDIHGLSQFLAQIEAGDSRIRVLVLSISQGEPFASPRQPEILRLTLTIEGLARRSLAPPANTPRPKDSDL